jgi:hypothetical protein
MADVCSTSRMCTCWWRTHNKGGTRSTYREHQHRAKKLLSTFVSSWWMNFAMLI